MISIKTKGGIKRDRELSEKIIWFCIKKLLPRHRNIDVLCTFSNCYDIEGLWGWCWEGGYSKSYEIGIDNKLSREGVLLPCDGIDDFITTVCHEMVHVMQYATKKYIQSDSTVQWWKCKDSKYRNYANTKYDRQPWETQAYAMQETLAGEYIRNNFDDIKVIMKNNGNFNLIYCN